MQGSSNIVSSVPRVPKKRCANPRVLKSIITLAVKWKAQRVIQFFSTTVNRSASMLSWSEIDYIRDLKSVLTS